MTPSRAPFGALSDLRIIDLTQMLAGPYATMMLADHGAQVIKIESPEGDMSRTAGGAESAAGKPRTLVGYFQSIDRNKDSVVLDLKTEGGRNALKALIKDADALVENFRVGVMERLGLGYEILKEINPRLVYGAVRGFGDPRTGVSPYQHWPAFDVTAQAMGGIMAITGTDPATPTKIGPGIGDIVPGMMLGFGLLAAIHNARRTGVGQFVDVAMTDAMLAICERTLWQYSTSQKAPVPEGNHHPFLCPFGIFPAVDGFVSIAAHFDPFFETFCRQIDAPELLDDPAFATRDARVRNRLNVIEQIAERTRRFTKAELAERLGGRLPFGPVMDIAEIERDPHFIARDMIVDVDEPGHSPIQVAGVPIKLARTPGGVNRRAPYLGEHTRQRLAEAGLSAAEIDHLIAQREAAAFDGQRG